jgi:bacillithiol biosynthesis deacetylase BshB1
MTPVDILAFGAHPDDVELAAGGTVAKHTAMGKQVAIVDLTRGEMGTRGSAEIRHEEAQRAKEILGVAHRINLDLGDAVFENDHASQLRVIEMVRRFRPRVVLANALHDRHPDHGRAAQLVSTACFMAGLRKITTQFEGSGQEPWRPAVMYHYVQGYYLKPAIIVDISDHFDAKMQAIRCYESQFYNPDSKDSETLLSQPWFMNQLEARAIEYGRPIGAKYGEGFQSVRDVGVRDLMELL